MGRKNICVLQVENLLAMVATKKLQACINGVKDGRAIVLLTLLQIAYTVLH